MTARSFFITGTDTGVGKTHVACALLQAAGRRGWRTAALKPVAAGGDRIDGRLCNDDALALQQSCSEAITLGELNPVCLAEPIAPHIAAAREGLSLSVGELLPSCRKLLSRRADLTLVEGAGGWLVPLNEGETLADLALALELPVILVVGMRLGCLNHALLSAASIRASGLELAGWVANHLSVDMPVAGENVRTLTERLEAPLLAEFPCGSPDDSARQADRALMALWNQGHTGPEARGR